MVLYCAVLVCDVVVAFCYLNALQLKSIRCFYGVGLCGCCVVEIKKPVVTALVPKGACTCKPVASRGLAVLVSGHAVFAASTQSTLIGSRGV